MNHHVAPHNQRLFNYFADNHELTLLESEMEDIRNLTSKLSMADEDELFESRATIEQLRKENTALKAVLAEVEKQTGQVREILRVAANNMAVLHHE